MNLNNPIEEFQYLETVTDKPPESFTEKVLKYPKATSFHNFAKNRYKNVLPNEETRVKLKPVEGISDSDYINANFVKSGGTTYICCQAPMPTTIADFWRMIWEQEACVIVMLTELVSTDGQAKAHVYWPISRELSLVVGHNFKVTLLNEIQEGSITVRFLEMSLSGDACVESRKITQIHYTGWPDFSLPSTATEFKNLLRSTDLYKDRTPKEDGSKRPLVVHCSAGVGRTGVFVAGRTCLKIVKQGKQASILQIVKSLRDQRTGMVSTLQQYQFLYTLVNSYVPAKRRSLPTLVCHPHIHENTTMFEPVSAPSLIV